MSIEQTLEEQAETSAEVLHIVGRAVRLIRNASENLAEAALALADIDDLSKETILAASASNLTNNLYEQLDELLEALEEEDDQETTLIPLADVLKSPAQPLTASDFVQTQTITPSLARTLIGALLQAN